MKVLGTKVRSPERTVSSLNHEVNAPVSRCKIVVHGRYSIKYKSFRDMKSNRFLVLVASLHSLSPELPKEA